MAESWIRVRSYLSRTRVAEKLAPICKNDKQKAVGVLVDFWSGVAEFGKNGYVRETDDQTLEDWANWRGKRGAFAAWIRSQHMDDDGRVPHWDEYMGTLETKRLIDRERKRLERESQKGAGQSFGQSAGHPEDDPLDGPYSVFPDGTETVRNGSSSSVSDRARLLESLPTPSRRYGMDACLRVWEQGIDLPPGMIPTKAQIDKACREVMASVDPGELKPRVVRGFLLRVMRGETDPAPSPPRDGDKRSMHDDTYDNALAGALAVQALAKEKAAR